MVDLTLVCSLFIPKSHSGFSSPWQFVVAFKSFDTKADWLVDESLINLKIRQRLLPTVKGESSLLHFDGATMLSYLHPSKASETVFCRRSSKPRPCEAGHGFDPDRENLPLSVLEVKQSGLGEKAGKGVFAKIDIPHLSYLGLDKLISTIHMNPSSQDIMSSMVKHQFHDYNWPQCLNIYIDGYGHRCRDHVSIRL